MNNYLILGHVDEFYEYRALIEKKLKVIGLDIEKVKSVLNSVENSSCYTDIGCIFSTAAYGFSSKDFMLGYGPSKKCIHVSVKDFIELDEKIFIESRKKLLKQNFKKLNLY